MKRVRCPKCEHFIVFDDKGYADGSRLVFECPDCGKQFAIRIGVSKLLRSRKECAEHPDETPSEVGQIVVIENVFHYKQIIPLRMGDNVIGRRSKDGRTTCPIETVDPSVDLQHCVINVSRDKHGALKYVLRDGPSNTGTFVDNQILGDKERRVIENGTLFTIGATSIILKAGC